MSSSVSWVCLESNPDVMTSFLHGIGLSPEFKVVDVLGFDEELVDMLPKPVYALILLYPVEKVIVSDNGDNQGEVSKDVYFMKQTIRNACGTFALLHCVANLADKLSFAKDSPIEKFLAETANMTPEERGNQVEQSQEIADVHEEEARRGQTIPPDAECTTDNHFITFLERGGRLYELDGRKKGPIDHGASSPETFAKDVAKLCQKIVAQTDEPVFSAAALVKE